MIDSEPTRGQLPVLPRPKPVGISDNDRKYYSLERAKEVLGYDPEDNSADFTFEGEPKEDLVEE